MAISVRPDQLGALVDPYGGWADLQDRVLRVLHGLSFLDDPTRAFRAARFAARFDLRLAGGTRGLLDGAVAVGAFARVGMERIGHELERIFTESTADRALALLRDWGVLAAALPGLKVDAELLQALDAARDGATEARGLLPAGQAPSPADCAWIALGTGFSPEARPPLQRLVPGDLRRQRRFVDGPERVLGALGKLGHVRRPSYAGRTLSGLDDVERAAALGLARATPHQDEARAWLRWWWQEGAAARTPVDGGWLQAEGVPPGPVYKKALQRAQDACWDGEDADGQRAAAWAVARAADAGPLEG
jgi:tRNA nucleotidyltransferase (CCA-adding enzyme)